jgi:hypothetical protein
MSILALNRQRRKEAVSAGKQVNAFGLFTGSSETGVHRRSDHTVDSYGTRASDVIIFSCALRPGKCDPDVLSLSTLLGMVPTCSHVTVNV